MQDTISHFDSYEEATEKRDVHTDTLTKRQTDGAKIGFRKELSEK